MKLIDLSLPIFEGIPFYPGDIKTTISRLPEAEKTEWTATNIHMSLHAATHVESAAHAIEGGRTLDSYTLDTFVAEAQCIKREQIGKVVVDKEVLLIYTGSDKLWPQPEYSQRRLEMSIEEAQWLVKQNLKVVGNDTISIGNLEIHQIIFNTGSLIIESLGNLEMVLNKRFRLYFFPLKLSQESSPVRVVAELT